MPRNVDRQVVAARWRERSFSCDLWVDPPGQIWADFIHDTDELVMVVEGDVEFEIGGTAHRPAPGEELLIPAKTIHTVRNIGGRGSRWLYGYKLDVAETGRRIGSWSEEKASRR